MQNKISIVIPTKDRTDDLKRCLDSIVSQLDNGDEIIIVDGGNIDQTERMLKTFYAFNVKLISDSVPNVSHALNMGWMNACNEIIAFVNDDIEFTEEWVKNVKYWFIELPDAKSIGGTTRDINERKMEYTLRKHPKISKLYDRLIMGGYLYKTGIITEWGSYSIGNIEPLRPMKVSGFSGANMIFLKSILLELGGFSTIFKYAGFEGHIYLQLLKRNYSVYLVPGCSVKHYPSPTGGTRNIFYLAQDYAVFFRMLRPNSLLGKIRKALNELSFLLFWIIIYKGNTKKLRVLFKGYIHGLKLYKKYPNGDVIA